MAPSNKKILKIFTLCSELKSRLLPTVPLWRKLTATFIVSLQELVNPTLNSIRHNTISMRTRIDDPPDREVVNIFIRNNPLVVNRTFVDLVATLYCDFVCSILALLFRSSPVKYCIIQLLE